MSVTLHTNLGDIKIELFNEQAPKACENFLALCASGYYNGCEFHRNIPGFIIQTGDPTNVGNGGQSIWGVPFEDEIGSLRHNKRGVVSMANSGTPDSNQSQFFITYGKHEHLDGAYTVFGQVIHGMDVLEKAEKTPCDKSDRPLRAIVLRKVTIHANPLAE